MASETTRQMAQDIKAFLSAKGITPTAAWMEAFLPAIRPNIPVANLQRTALFRILATDLITSVQATSVFPANVSDPQTQEVKLPGPIVVQVLDIEDIGHSRWSQVENIEAHERGEMTKGREIVRVVPDENNSDPHQAPDSTASAGPHKLLLQDAKGTNVYAFEMNTIQGIGVQMSIGSKMVLRNVTVARGAALLEPKGVEILGGKVEAWDRVWRSERKSELKRKAEMGTEI